MIWNIFLVKQLKLLKFKTENTKNRVRKDFIMLKQKYGRPSTGQKGNNRPTVVISRENYDEVDSLSLGTGMSRSAIVDYFISEGLKKARIEEVIIKTKRLVLED